MLLITEETQAFVTKEFCLYLFPGNLYPFVLVTFKIIQQRGSWVALSVEQAGLILRVLSSNPTLGEEFIFKKCSTDTLPAFV